MAPPRRLHDFGIHESWDKFVLFVAFMTGICGGIILKVMGLHPFVTAGYSAAVLCLYALTAYVSTPLRLEPEVIGDNSYYLGFLLTLTSLSVTLYFVVEAGPEDRARLIPEVISGFGVALVSTIVGVFIRVLMMQFRLDVVSRERETRVEIDEAARRLRTEMSQALQQMKLFGVESLQRAQEREEKFAQTTNQLVSEVQRSLGQMAGHFYEELSKTVREQSSAAVETIRISVQVASEAALRQISASLGDIGSSTHHLASALLDAGSMNEKANATLNQQTQALSEMVAHLFRQLLSTVEDVESSGGSLSRSISAAAGRLDQSLLMTTKQLDTVLSAFEEASLASIIKTDATLNMLATKFTTAVTQVELATGKLTNDNPG